MVSVNLINGDEFMEEKESKTPKHCLNCRYYETYYTKCASTFYRHKTGYCSQQQKLTENHDTCEEWKRKDGRFKRNLHRDVASEIVTKMAKDILIIAQILCDDKTDEREEKE